MRVSKEQLEKKEREMANKIKSEENMLIMRDKYGKRVLELKVYNEDYDDIDLYRRNMRSVMSIMRDRMRQGIYDLERRIQEKEVKLSNKSIEKILQETMNLREVIEIWRKISINNNADKLPLDVLSSIKTQNDEIDKNIINKVIMQYRIENIIAKACIEDITITKYEELMKIVNEIFKAFNGYIITAIMSAYGIKDLDWVKGETMIVIKTNEDTDRKLIIPDKDDTDDLIKDLSEAVATEEFSDISI